MASSVTTGTRGHTDRSGTATSPQGTCPGKKLGQQGETGSHLACPPCPSPSRPARGEPRNRSLASAPFPCHADESPRAKEAPRARPRAEPRARAFFFFFFGGGWWWGGSPGKAFPAGGGSTRHPPSRSGSLHPAPKLAACERRGAGGQGGIRGCAPKSLACVRVPGCPPPKHTHPKEGHRCVHEQKTAPYPKIYTPKRLRGWGIKRKDGHGHGRNAGGAATCRRPAGAQSGAGTPPDPLFWGSPKVFPAPQDPLTPGRTCPSPAAGAGHAAGDAGSRMRRARKSGGRTGERSGTRGAVWGGGGEKGWVFWGGTRGGV